MNSPSGGEVAKLVARAEYSLTTNTMQLQLQAMTCTLVNVHHGIVKPSLRPFTLRVLHRCDAMRPTPSFLYECPSFAGLSANEILNRIDGRLVAK